MYTQEQIGKKVLRKQTSRTKDLFNLYVFQKDDDIHEPVLICASWHACADKTKELVKNGVSWTDIYGDQSRPLLDGGGIYKDSWGQCIKHLWLQDCGGWTLNDLNKE